MSKPLVSDSVASSSSVANASVIACEHVSKIVETAEAPITILSDVSLSVSAGESVAILGQSGSGKTTLLCLLAGLDIPSSGSIRLLDEPLENLNEDERAILRQRHAGFVFQAFHLLPGFTALENVMLPLEIAGHTDASQQAAEWLERVGLGHRLDHYPTTLSGGEQQRVAVARAFATNPPILFADEPTGNLDTDTGHGIIDLLFELNQAQGTTLILVTHDIELAQRCQRQCRLNNGVLESL